MQSLKDKFKQEVAAAVTTNTALPNFYFASELKDMGIDMKRTGFGFIKSEAAYGEQHPDSVVLSYKSMNSGNASGTLGYNKKTGKVWVYTKCRGGIDDFYVER